MIKNPHVSDRVVVNAEQVPLDRSRDGVILAVEEHPTGAKTVTVLLDSGQEQDILASEMEREALSAQNYDENDEPFD